MIFIDANVFIYAFMAPRRSLKEHEKNIKDGAREIIERIENGEKVVTSLVHLSEVSNVLENAMKNEQLVELLRSILEKENVLVMDCGADSYLLALDLAIDYGIGPNDALALVIMGQLGISRIYSFDSHFSGIDGVERVTG